MEMRTRGREEDGGRDGDELEVGARSGPPAGSGGRGVKIAA